MFIGLVNALTIIISALTGQNAYVLANNLPAYLFDTVLCFIPISLTSIAIIWWLIDLYFKPADRVNYIAIAFSGILVDAVFVIGSAFFASGH
jgi:hypothetical protein